MKTRRSITRRGFLAHTAGVGLASGLAASLPTRRVLGANDRIGFGLIGCGGRGRFVADVFRKAGAELRACCDVYEPNLNAGLALAGSSAKPYADHRALLESPDIDAVLIATPDHWHAQMIIDAVTAGKDVYVEKPMGHTADEGFRVLDAVEKTGRIVQVGTQRRSYHIFLEAKSLIDSGALGIVHLVISGWFARQADSLADRPLAGRLDWDRWLGPAPRRPLDAKRFFNWYHYWDYSGGLTVGQGAHMLDAINWFTGSTYPLAVTCVGTRPHTQGAEVPETTTMTVEYPAPPLPSRARQQVAAPAAQTQGTKSAGHDESAELLVTFSLGYRSMRYAPVNDQFAQFHGTRARLDMGRESFVLYPDSGAPIDLKPTHSRREPGAFDRATHDHVANFLSSTRSRQAPNAPASAGHYANVILAMAMHSLRHGGARVLWNPDRRAMEM